MAKGWKRPFDEPIPLPDGRQLVTLEEAGNYITKLPKDIHEEEEWQAAMESPHACGDARGTDHVCAHRRHESVEPPRRTRDPSRKDKHWGRRKLARDQ
jgi:hypothetical protein